MSIRSGRPAHSFPFTGKLLATIAEMLLVLAVGAGDVSAQDPFQIVSFTAVPDTVPPFGTTELSWSVTGSAQVSIDGFGPVAQSGSLTTQPERTRSYTLRAAWGAIAREAQAQVVVDVQGSLPGFVAVGWQPDAWPGTPPVLHVGEPFTFYVVANSPPGGVEAWELGVVVPPCLLVLERRFEPTSGGLDVGPGEDNFIVGTGGLCLTGGFVRLASYRVVALGAGCLHSEVTVDLTSATPSSVVPPAPAYLTCGSAAEIRRFMVGPPLSLNPQSVAWPSVVSFEAQPETLAFGEIGQLLWQTVNADAVSIEPGGHLGLPTTGTLSTDPVQTTTYTLTAANQHGHVATTATVTRIPFRLASFTADRQIAQPHESVTLSWNVEGAPTAVVLDGVGAVPPVGSLVTEPERTRSYLLRVTGGGFAAESSVSVEVAVTPATPGQLALSWQTLQIPGSPPRFQVGEVFDFYVLAVQPQDGALEYELSVIPPSCLIVTDATPMPQPGALDTGAGANNWIVATSGACLGGELTTLVHYRARSFQASCFAPGRVIDLGPPTPSLFAPPAPSYVPCSAQAVPRRFVVGAPLSLVPAGGSGGAVILSFTATPTELGFGQTGQLQWATRNATHVEIDPGFPDLPTSGAVAIDPAATTTYTLTASNDQSIATATLTVQRLPFAITSFTASPNAIDLGDSTVLAWEVVGAADVSIDGLGPQLPVGTQAVWPTASRVYILRVRNGELERTSYAWVAVDNGTGTAVGTIAASWSTSTVPGLRPAIGPFVPFDFHCVALAPPDGMLAYGFSVSLPPGLLVAGGRVIHPPGSAVDFGVGDDNFIVGTGGVCMSGPIVPLVDYVQCLFLSYPLPNSVIRVGPASPSSFGDPPRPEYLTCLAPGDVRPLLAGPPLVITGDGGGEVPAIAMRLEARREGTGVVVRWQLSGADAAGASIEQIELLRWEGEATPRVVAVITRPEAGAQGTWMDGTASPAAAHRYGAVATVQGTRIAAPAVEVLGAAVSLVPARTRLVGAFPNPFNPRTEIRFELAAAGDARLSVFDAAGRLVRVAEFPALSAGPHAWIWDGADVAGRGVASGVYRVRVDSGGVDDALSVTVVR